MIQLPQTMVLFKGVSIHTLRLGKPSIWRQRHNPEIGYIKWGNWFHRISKLQIPFWEHKWSQIAKSLLRATNLKATTYWAYSRCQTLLSTSFPVSLSPHNNLMWQILFLSPFIRGNWDSKRLSNLLEVKHFSNWTLWEASIWAHFDLKVHMLNQDTNRTPRQNPQILFGFFWKQINHSEADNLGKKRVKKEQLVWLTQSRKAANLYWVLYWVPIALYKAHLILTVPSGKVLLAPIYRLVNL